MESCHGLGRGIVVVLLILRFGYDGYFCCCWVGVDEICYGDFYLHENDFGWRVLKLLEKAHSIDDEFFNLYYV